MQGVRSGKLRLKGDKPRPSVRVEKARSSSTSRVRQETDKASEPSSLWVDLRETEHLNGPVLLLTTAPGEKCMLVISEEGVPSFKALSELQMTWEGPEPTDPGQVLRARSLVRGKFVFKTAQEKYLSSDSLGKVTASRAAVGPSEEWLVGKGEDGFVLENYLGRYLSMDRDTGRVRADAESIGPQEVFRLRCQTTEMHESASEQTGPGLHSSTTADLGDVEAQESGKYVSWGARRKPTASKLSGDDLQQARASGQLHEALLERRIKSKHDPFC